MQYMIPWCTHGWKGRTHTLLKHTVQVGAPKHHSNFVQQTWHSKSSWPGWQYWLPTSKLRATFNYSSDVINLDNQGKGPISVISLTTWEVGSRGLLWVQNQPSLLRPWLKNKNKRKGSKTKKLGCEMMFSQHTSVQMFHPCIYLFVCVLPSLGLHCNQGFSTHPSLCP